MSTDIEELEALATKMEQETQVYLGFRNVERAASIRRVVARVRALEAESPTIPSPAPTPKSVVQEPDDRPGRASMAEQVEFLDPRKSLSRRRFSIEDFDGTPSTSGNLPGQGNTGPGSTIYNPQYQEYLDAHGEGSPAPLIYATWLAVGQPKTPVADIGEDGG